MVQPEEEICLWCPHPFGPHLLVATSDDPMMGGVTICQIVGCQCYSTWRPGGLDKSGIVIPDRAQLEAMREQLQD